MSEGEGWNGRTLRQHVEDAARAAAEAVKDASAARGGARSARDKALGAHKLAESAERQAGEAVTVAHEARAKASGASLDVGVALLQAHKADLAASEAASTADEARSHAEGAAWAVADLRTEVDELSEEQERLARIVAALEDRFAGNRASVPGEAEAGA